MPLGVGLAVGRGRTSVVVVVVVVVAAVWSCACCSILCLLKCTPVLAYEVYATPVRVEVRRMMVWMENGEVYVEAQGS